MRQHSFVTILLGVVSMLIFSFSPGKRIFSNEVSGETFIRSAIDPGCDADSQRISGKDTLAPLPGDILGDEDFMFLESLTKDVLESSRIVPGQVISSDFGPNNTGGVLIRPGGRNAYPSFWIRDYAMSLESGLIPLPEQKHMLRVTASTQCDQTWIT